MSDEPPLLKELHGALKKHGHAFQYATIRRAEALFADRRSKWMFNSSEIPVEVRGTSTRVDFVLQWSENHGTDALLIAECKRANPALADWCFTKAPYIRRDQRDNVMIFDEVQRHPGAFSVQSCPVPTNSTIYHVGYELRSDKKGEGAPGRGAIEEGCAQALRGMSGLIHLLRSHPEPLIVNRPTRLIPVLFTTALLWTSSVDLGGGDLRTGEIDRTSLPSLQSVPWLWYRYPMSPALTPDISRNELSQDIGNIVEGWFARYVAIVSADGIDSFLVSDLR